MPERTAPADRNVEAPPWKHNPSSWRQRIPIAALASVAFLISAYMALYQWRLIPGVWDPVFGDQSSHVLDSAVSEQMKRWIGIPDAALGAIAYLGDVLFGLAGSTRRWQYRPWLVILFGIDVIPVGIVSAVLVFLQATVVGQWCFLCLVTAVISLVLVLYAYDEVWSSLLYLWRVWRRTQSGRLLWRIFWGGAAPGAHEAALAGARTAASPRDTVRDRPAPGLVANMWPRLAEMLLGLWLLAGPLFISGAGRHWPHAANCILCGLAVLASSSLSFWAPARRAHLLNGMVAVWLAGFGWSTAPRPGPPIVQNEITTGFLLLLLFLIPSPASLPPEPWRRLESGYGR